jgi:hypothetical protein
LAGVAVFLLADAGRLAVFFAGAFAVADLAARLAGFALDLVDFALLEERDLGMGTRRAWQILL